MSHPYRQIVLCLSILFLCCINAKAENLWLAGSEFSPDNNYAYIGTIMPLKGKEFTDGFVQRYWLDWLTYQYDNGSNTIKADAFGAEAALGYQQSGEKYWASAYLGALYRYTSLSPNDPGSNSDGGKLRPKVLLQYNRWLTKSFELGMIGSYIFNQDGYWTRARLAHSVTQNLRLGPELIAHGDPDYEIIQTGIFLTGIKLTEKINLGVKAGVKMVRNDSDHGYFGLEFDGWF